MALIKIPNVTLHRSSLANASRIIKLNMADQSFDQPLIDSIPVLVPNHRAVGNFFFHLEAAFYAANLGTGYIELGFPRLYISDINKQLKVVNYNFWTMAGLPLPDSPPVLMTNITDEAYTQNSAITTKAVSSHWAGAPTGYTITALNEGLAMDPVTGDITGTPTAVDNFNPIVTATNDNGSTESNVFNIMVTAP